MKSGLSGLTPKIVMIGTGRATRGGISAMVNVYFAAGLFERWDAEYLETHCDGSKARKAFKALGSWVRFLGRLATGSVALLHVHIASDASFWRKALFVVPAHALGVPYILHMHGGDFGRYYRERCGPLAQRFLASLYRNARAVIALSDEWKRAIEAVVPDARVVVVPNPIEVPEHAAPLDGPPTVLYLGMVKEAKGVYDLLRAWPAVRTAHPEAKLVFGGSGELEKARTLAEELGVADSLELPGWTTGPAKEELLQRATVFILPSHFEALPMAVLEAMAAGLPVIATNVGGIPDAIEDGRDGVLVEPRDQAAIETRLIELLADPTRAKQLGKAARARAQEAFSAPVIVPQVEALWRELKPETQRLRETRGPQRKATDIGAGML